MAYFGFGHLDELRIYDSMDGMPSKQRGRAKRRRVWGGNGGSFVAAERGRGFSDLFSLSDPVYLFILFPKHLPSFPSSILLRKL